MALFFPLISVAQTGPGGVGSTSDVQGWYDANNISGVTNGSQLDTWSDRMNSNDFSGTGSSRPTYNTNVINSLPAVNFSGSHVMSTGAISALGSTNQFTWIVVSQNNSTGFGYLINSRHSSFGQEFASSVNNTTFGTRVRLTPSGTNALNAGSSAGFHILSATWDAAAGNHNNFLDGANGASSTSAAGAPGTHISLVMGRNSAANNNFLTGDIAEAIVYSTNIDTADRIIVENYLSSKYGIGMSANDKYSHDGTHGNEVAGIGRENASNLHTDAQGTGIVQINGADDLGDGEYLLFGHDAGGITTTNSDSPASFGSTGLRLTQEWRVDETGGDVGTVDVKVYLSTNTFGPNTDYQILIDADGDFTSGAVATTGVWVPGDTAVLFSNIDFSSVSTTAFFTFGNPNSGAISSTTTGNWNSTSTWDCSCIPTETDSVVISANDVVTVNTSAVCGDLNILVDGTIDFDATNSLDINGDFIMAGTFTPGTGEVIFSGTTAQSISNSSGGTLSFYDLTINSTGTVTASSGEMDLTNQMDLNTGTFANSTVFNFESDATRTASIASVGSGTISGPSSYVVKRFVASRPANWGDIASPVTSTSISTWDADIFMSGVGGGNGNACCPVFQSVYTFDAVGDTFTAVTSTATTVSAGEGVELWLASNSTTLSDLTFQSKGTIDLSDQAISVNSSGSGYNLLGNPFPMFLSWTSISSDGAFGSIADEFAVFNPSTGTYSTYTDGDNIPPCQGFWVRSTGASTLNLRASHAASSNSSTFLKRDPKANEIKLNVSVKDYPFHHTAHVRFEDNALAEKEVEDWPLMKSRQVEAPHISTNTPDGDKLFINYTNDFSEYTAIPVTVDAGISGYHMVRAVDLKNFENYDCVTLEDPKDGTITDLSQGGYTFFISNEEEDYELILHLAKEGSVHCRKAVEEVAEAETGIEVVNDVNGILVNFNYDETINSTVTVYNLLGQPIMAPTRISSSEGQTRLETPELPGGTYTVVVENDIERISQKVVLF